MKKIEDVAVIIQARLSSQRCVRKMIRPFSDTTLMDITLQKLQKSNIPNENVWCSVYENDLRQLCGKYPFNIFERSKKSSSSEGTPLTEIYEWWDKIPQTHIVLINACCPFIEVETIENFYNDYLNSNSDGMFAVIEKRNYFWDQDRNFMTSLTEDVMNTKTAKIIYEAAHCLYAGSTEKIGQGIWMGDFNVKDDVELWTMKEEETLDIDYEWQFKMCETLYKQSKINEDR
jgi:CMP-N-acetylneuraminic acid synthetase